MIRQPYEGNDTISHLEMIARYWGMHKVEFNKGVYIISDDTTPHMREMIE